MIIAIDGPAAAGKGTLARLLAAHFDLAYLDTGSLYRAVALNLIRSGGNPSNLNETISAAKAIDKVDLNDPELRTEKTTKIASKIAAIPAVRAQLITFQRDFADAPPNNKRGAVLDGRDIGTVVYPDADIKFFVTANLNERAQRRYDELKLAGIETSKSQIQSEMADRDQRDQDRNISPLTRANDAHLLNTTNLDIDCAFAYAKAFILAS